MGDEIRIYSPLGGIGFDRCLLHSIKRQELASDSAIEILRKFLSRESLVTKRVHQHVNERGTELRQAYEKLEKLNDDYGTLRENIYADMAKLEAQIESNRKEIDELEAKRQAEERDLWRQLGLPLAGSGPTSPPVPPAEQHPRSETDTIDFEALILSTLQEIGGQGNVREILMRIENKLRAKGELTPYWQEPDPTQIRWKHAVHSARFRLVKQGKMSGKTETGVWELTEQGRRAARNLSKG